MLTKLRRSPIPLYVQVADLMRQRIQRRNWPTGHRLATLAEMVTEFGVARVTIRQAMDLLEAEGVIVRRQGLGTFVAGPGVGDPPLRVATSLEALTATMSGTTPDILMLAEGDVSPLLRPSEGRAAPGYHYMRRVHNRDGKPYAVIAIYLAGEVFALAPERFRSELVIPLLMSLPGVEIARAHQTLTIGTADVEEAGFLGISPNAPTAGVRRVFTDRDGVAIYLGEVLYRGDFIRVEMDLMQ